MSEPRDEDAGVPARPPVASSNLPFHDDDELANALAAQLLRFAPSGPIPIIRPEDAGPAVMPGSSPSVDSGLSPEPETAREQEPEQEPDQRQMPEPEQVSAREQVSEDGVRDQSGPPPVTAPIATVSTPSAVVAGAESALQQAVRLQPALDALVVDDETLQAWERSLLALAPEAPPPAEASDSPDRPGTPASDDESDLSARPSSPDQYPDPDSDLEPAAVVSDADADDTIGPRRGTFDPLPLPLTTAALVPVGAPSASEDDDRSGTDPALDALPDASPADEPETTSTITVGAPAPEASLPQDELIATIVPPGSAPTGELDVVEAEVLEQDGESRDETVGTDDADRGDAGDVHDGSASDAGAASVPVITGLVPTPTRWPVDGEETAAPMRRPSIPGVPADSTQDDDGHPTSAVDTSVGASSEEESGPSASDDAEPTPVAPQVQAGSLITDTGSIRLPGETMLLGAGTSHASLDTGSVPVFAGGIELDVDLEDDVDDVAEPVEVLAADNSALPIAPAEAGDLTGPIVPISTATLIGVPAAATMAASDDRDEAVDGHAAADRVPAPAPRAADEVDPPVDSLEPTPQDLRIAGAGRQFWMWVAPNTSALTLGLGAVLLGSGLSARQSILATVVGLLLAALPLGLTTLAVARSGQPSAVVSRASFGTAGNIVPTILLLIVRLFWIAMLLWLLATSVDSLVFESGYDLFVDPAIAAIVALGLLGAGATVVAAFGLAVITRVQAILTVLAVVSVGALVAATASRLDFGRIIGSVDGDVFTVVAGAMIVLALLGTAWAGIGGDIARRQRAGGSGVAVAASTGLGATLPALVLITWGVLLAASDDALSVGLQTDPVATIAQSVPGWYPLPLLLAVSAAILAGISTMGYSGGLTLMALGVPVSRASATILVMLVGVAGGGAILAIVPGLTPMLVDIVPALAVPVLAWAGIVATEVLLRRRPLDARSLMSRGGAYPAVRWGNLGALAVITAIGWGLLSPSQGWFEAEGYLWRILGIATDAGLGATDLGVAAALVLGMLTPLVLGIAAIRRQEGGEVVDRPVRLEGSSPVVAPLEG